jgi:hypothetical protein
MEIVIEILVQIRTKDVQQQWLLLVTPQTLKKDSK